MLTSSVRPRGANPLPSHQLAPPASLRPGACAAGALVLLPDVLLSGTRVASSFKCVRQAVLEECFGGRASAKAVEGTLLHELFQAALLDAPATADSLEAHARSIAMRNTEKLIDVGLDEEQVRGHLQRTRSRTGAGARAHHEHGPAGAGGDAQRRGRAAVVAAHVPARHASAGCRRQPGLGPARAARGARVRERRRGH